MPRLTVATVTSIQNNLITVALMALALGIFIPIAGMALHVLVRRGIHNLFPRGLLLGTVIVLFISTILGFSSSLALSIYSCPGSMIPSETLLDNLSLTADICGYLNFLLSDLIVVWRAWVLLINRGSRIALGIIFLITVGSTTTVSTLEIAMTRISKLKWWSSIDENVSISLLIGPLIATNMIATTVVAYKTWIYRTKIKVHLHEEGKRRTVERILILLLESGFIYCAIWIFGLCNAIHQALLPANTVLSGYDNLMNDMQYLQPFISAIYPVTIIYLVEQGRIDDFEHPRGSLIAHSIQFAHPRSVNSSSIIETIADHIRFTRQDERISHSPVTDQITVEHRDQG